MWVIFISLGEMDLLKGFLNESICIVCKLLNFGYKS